MPRTLTFQTQTTVELQECVVTGCSMFIALSADQERDLRRSHASFYCAAGHGQSYTGESDIEKAERLRKAAEAQVVSLRDQLDAEKQNRAQAEKRAKAALCPVPGCHRQIVQMKRHLQTKHPEFVHDHA